MRPLRPLVTPLVLGLGLSACGGASGAGGTTPASGDDGQATINIPASEWTRTAIGEAGLSIELPGEATRQVVTRDTTHDVRYVIERGHFGALVLVETLGGVVTPEHEEEALDRGAGAIVHSLSSSSHCTARPAESVTVAGRPARLVLGDECREPAQGAMATVMWLHGSAFVSALVATEHVSAGALRPVLERMIESVELGEAPSWFLPVDQDVTPPNLTGVHFSMPGAPHSEVVQTEEQTVARYTSEPIHGLAALAIAASPSPLTFAQYCDALVHHERLTMTERRDGTLERAGVPYCEVRGRRAADTNLLEVHDLMLVGGGVLELVWVGPMSPSFVAGGDLQMAAMRSSVRVD